VILLQKGHCITLTVFSSETLVSTGYATGRFIVFSVITNIYNKKTKVPTLMELFTETGKLKKFLFLQLEMFDVCTTGDTAHIDTIFKSCHTRVNLAASIFFTAAMVRAFRSVRSRGNGGTNTWSLTYPLKKKNHRV